jgi:hypothetical protein
MGDPTSSYATAGIALRISGTLKTYHHDKVETPSVGFLTFYLLLNYYNIFGLIHVNFMVKYI